MTPPTLPQEDLALIAEMSYWNEKFRDITTGSRSYTYQAHSIITRLQAALEIAVRQRDTYAAMIFIDSLPGEIVESNKELTAALRGDK